ncbi:MAG: DMT family transporter [Planctomycetes bacterium]|nr:DMT family transporter [Planctomycetota bacterium]
MSTPSEHPGSRSAHLALLACQFCFGLFPLFGKRALEEFAPGVVAGWRIVVGSLVFALLALAVHGRDVLPRRKHVVPMFACAFFGIALNQALFLEGLERSSSVNTGLMMMVIPLFTYLIAVLVRQEPWSTRRITGIVIALSGTSYLVLQRGLDLRSDYLVGNLLLIANTLSYATFLVAAKPLMRLYPPLVFTGWMYALCLWSVPFLSVDGPVFPDASTGAWWSLVMVLVFPTTLAYLLNMYALQHVRASTIAVYVFLQPLIAGVAGVTVRGESFGWSMAVAATLMLAGVWTVVRRPRGR